MNKNKNYQIGVDLAKPGDTDLSCAIISTINENGDIEIKDSLTSKNPDDIKNFINKYDSNYFSLDRKVKRDIQFQKLRRLNRFKTQLDKGGIKISNDIKFYSQADLEKEAYLRKESMKYLFKL